MAQLINSNTTESTNDLPATLVDETPLKASSATTTTTQPQNKSDPSDHRG
jgi:hypothetical protein